MSEPTPEEILRLSEAVSGEEHLNPSWLRARHKYIVAAANVAPGLARELIAARAEVERLRGVLRDVADVPEDVERMLEARCMAEDCPVCIARAGLEAPNE